MGEGERKREKRERDLAEKTGRVQREGDRDREKMTERALGKVKTMGSSMTNEPEFEVGRYISCIVCEVAE